MNVARIEGEKAVVGWER